jgi:3-oxoacyl-[acyl-carrier protein] reductase
VPSALITGATSPIGRALVRAFAGAGYALGLHFHKGEAAARALAGEVNGLPLGADLTDVDAANALYKAFSAAHGTPDVLINNAGLSGDKLFLFLEPRDWDASIKTNLGSVYALTRAAVRGMIARRSGSVINIASVSGLKGLAGQAHYAAAKAGVIGFTRALAREIGRYNIRVNALAPGAIESPAVDKASAEARKWLEESACLGRIGKPEEVAGAALWLAGEGASFVTGQVIAVDGGIV